MIFLWTALPSHRKHQTRTPKKIVRRAPCVSLVSQKNDCFSHCLCHVPWWDQPSLKNSHEIQTFNLYVWVVLVCIHGCCLTKMNTHIYIYVYTYINYDFVCFHVQTQTKISNVHVPCSWFASMHTWNHPPWQHATWCGPMDRSKSNSVVKSYLHLCLSRCLWRIVVHPEELAVVNM